MRFVVALLMLVQLILPGLVGSSRHHSLVGHHHEGSAKTHFHFAQHTHQHTHSHSHSKHSHAYCDFHGDHNTASQLSQPIRHDHDSSAIYLETEDLALSANRTQIQGLTDAACLPANVQSLIGLGQFSSAERCAVGPPGCYSLILYRMLPHQLRV